MANPFQRLKREMRGQAMIETALLLPFLLMVVFNAVNTGYFFLVAINLAAAPHSGVLYSVLGSSTPLAAELPDPGPTSGQLSVSYLTLGDMTGALSNGGAAPVQVCTAKTGTSGSGTALITDCTQYNGSPSYAPDPDPEAPQFVLNRVDVTYTFRPLLDQRIFNLALLAAPICSGSSGSVTCTFHRQVSMRAMK